MNTLASQASINSKISAVCDIMRRSNCASALQYIPELTWLLFLRVLDERETVEAEEAAAVQVPFQPSLESPFRWQDWANPKGDKRKELQSGVLGETLTFVNEALLPKLHSLAEQSRATPRQRVVSQIMQAVESVRIDTEKNFMDVVDAIHKIKNSETDPTHLFLLSQAYESLLLRMGEKNNDGGQFFTPREVIRAMVRVADPKPGETIYDPGCGTGGFLAQSYEYMTGNLGQSMTADQMEQLRSDTFYGREKDIQIYPIALANLVLHGIDQPNIWHGNTLTNIEFYGGLFQGAPDKFDVILTNPPFGGREGPEAQTRYAYKTGATQVLFLQEVIDSLNVGGRASIVVDEGLLFRTNEKAFVQTKRKLMDDCDLWCIVSLPSGVFNQAGAGVKTNLLFFNKGKTTDKTWYYDLSSIKVNKGQPLTLSHFDEFFQLLPDRQDSERSWTVSRSEIEAKNYDLKAVNPNRTDQVDTRTPQDLIATIEAKGKEIDKALANLKGIL